MTLGPKWASQGHDCPDILYQTLCLCAFFSGKEVMSFWILIGVPSMFKPIFFLLYKNHSSMVSSFIAKDYLKECF